MSLINQVLQELEKRHAADPGVTSLPPQVRAVRTVPPTAMRVLAIALILVLAVVAAFVYLSGGWPPAASTRLIVTPQSDSVTKEISAPAPAKQATAAPAPALIEPAVQAVLLPPVSRLSEELSFNPGQGAPAVRAAKPKTGARAEIPRAPKSAAASRQPESAPVPAAVAATSLPAPAAPDSATTTAARPAPAESPPQIDKQMREMTVQQRAETAFRMGVAQLQDARVSAAETSFREALKEDPMHVGARQALLGLLLDG